MLVTWDEKTLNRIIRDEDLLQRLKVDQFVGSLKGVEANWTGTTKAMGSGRNPMYKRVEIRTSAYGVRVLITIRKDTRGKVIHQFSLGGKLSAPPSFYDEISRVMKEGEQVLTEVTKK